MEAEKKLEQFQGTGRRKTAVASVILRPGSGKAEVNGKEINEYFPLELQREKIYAPMKLLSMDSERYDMIIRVKGGGIEGQVEASRLGVARALVVQSHDNRQDLKSEGFLRRDPRKKERKKYGLRGARRAYQFSKR